MYESRDAGTVMRLRHSLQALAISADDQLALFPDFICEGDELALDFSNWYCVVSSNHSHDFTGNQQAALEKIDRMLDDMSGEENADLWTDDAVHTSPHWNTLRTLARIALAAFGWEVAIPPSYAHEYIGGQGDGSPGESR